MQTLLREKTLKKLIAGREYERDFFTDELILIRALPLLSSFDFYIIIIFTFQMDLVSKFHAVNSALPKGQQFLGLCVLEPEINITSTKFKSMVQ